MYLIKGTVWVDINIKDIACQITDYNYPSKDFQGHFA